MSILRSRRGELSHGERIELLRQTWAQTGQLFMLYDDALRKIEHRLEKIARTNHLIEMRDERAAAEVAGFLSEAAERRDDL